MARFFCPNCAPTGTGNVPILCPNCALNVPRKITYLPNSTFHTHSSFKNQAQESTVVRYFEGQNIPCRKPRTGEVLVPHQYAVFGMEYFGLQNSVLQRNYHALGSQKEKNLNINLATIGCSVAVGTEIIT